jgi:outer membrane lipoprotein-sorting protein
MLPCAALHAQGNLDKDEALRDIRRSLASIETIQASFSETLYSGKAQSTAKGTFIYQKPLSYKIESDAQGDDSGGAYYVYSEGMTHWVYVPAQKKAYKTDLALVEKKLGTQKLYELMNVGPHAALARLVENSMTRIASPQGDDADIYVFEGDCIPDLQQPPYNIARARLFIDKNTGLLRAMEGYDIAGEKVFVEEYSGYEVNKNIPEGTFTFTPAPNVSIEDVTADTILDLSQKS